MDVLGRIEALWRYPVKSLAPEPLQEARIEAGGIPGDRAHALVVRDGHARLGKPYRGKEHHLLHTMTEPERAVAAARDRGVSVELNGGAAEHFFDDAPISLVFDAWIAEVENALGMRLDPQRWRPNFFVKAAPGFALAETDMCGAILQAGSAVLRVREPIGRCITITYDVQTGEAENGVLLYIAQRRGNRMGIYCDVEVAGTVRAGDDLRLRAR